MKTTMPKTMVKTRVKALALLLLLFITLPVSAKASRFIDVKANAEGNLVIETSGITKEATFVNYATGGVVIQLLLVRAEDGSIRTTFNTCQSCNPSPRAYFVQKGSTFTCQNCGNSFPLRQIGLTKGGCNPAPVYEKRMDGTSLIIPASYLSQYAANFKNWQGPIK